jgi:hypothetical protein
LACTVLAGCQEETSEIPPAVADEVVRVGEEAAAELLRTLVGRLTSAMEEGGPVNAIEFCSAEAISLTRSVQEALPGGAALKRTSFRYRNPQNAPDEAEEEALLFFEEAILAEGTAPSSYVQKVSEGEMRYYQPLFLGAVCTQCHGDRPTMDPEVLKVLGEKYPGDLATGYEVGDFRGVVRVSIPTAEVTPGTEG